MKALALGIAGVLATIVMVSKPFHDKGQDSGILRVALPAPWGSLVPSQQNTLYGDIVLINEFESLVRIGRNGKILPLLAKNFTIGDNFESLEFEIDTEKKFSDGSPVTPDEIKSCWENGLRIQATSANNSTQDVLYLVKGYDEFERVGTLEGLKVSGHKLIVEFKKPYRQAIVDLAGGRYGVFKYVDGKAIGTGPYRTVASEQQKVIFERNTFFKGPVGYDKVEVIAAENAEELSRLEKSGTVDVFLIAPRRLNKLCREQSQHYQCLSGFVRRHVNLYSNSTKGIFANQEHRKALLSLIYDLRMDDQFQKYFKELPGMFDPQIYLPLQAGRLPAEEVKQTIGSYRRFVPALIEATNDQPIRMYALYDKDRFLVYLKSKGLKFSGDSGGIPFKDMLHLKNKSFEFDLLSMTASFYNADPDGIYHLLGENGAIFTPAIGTPKVMDLLEDGRTITDPNLLHHHYIKVSRAFLEEVSYVHVGFLYSQIIIRSDRVKYGYGLTQTGDDRFNVFRPATSLF